MNKKERVQAVLAHQPVDQLPIQFSYTAEMGAKLAGHFGVEVAALTERLNNHLLRVDLTHTPRLDEAAGVFYDWWGAGFSSREEGYFVKDPPLADPARLETFDWPDPDAPGLLDDAARQIRDNHEHRFVIPNQGFALFERAWSLRGFDTFMLDMTINPDMATMLLDRITDIQCRLAEHYLALGVDGGYFGDDYGTQNSLLISPDQWRAMIKPRLSRLFEVFKRGGKPVLMHSDGDLTPILPDLVEIGLDCLNPVQPEIYDYARLKKTFGDKLAFYGGISTQVALPQGTPASIRKSVEHACNILAGDGTGLILGPSHRMMGDIPVQNVVAMLESIEAVNGSLV